MTLAGLPVVWLLATARLWAMFRVQPAWRLAVGPWWNVAAIALAGLVALAVATPQLGIATWTELAIAVVVELGVGTVIGLLASLPSYALLGAAGGSALVMQTLPRPVVAVTVALVLATALSLGVHRPLLIASVDTFAFVPLGDPGAAELTTRAVADGAHAMLVMMLALSTPALLAGVTFELAARLIGRGPGPASAATSTAPWLRLAAAMIALGASWSAYAPAWTQPLLPP